MTRRDWFILCIGLGYFGTCLAINLPSAFSAVLDLF